MRAESSSVVLNVASFATRTQALGPGLRSVIWAQGCPLHCRGCIAPDWIPFRPAMIMSPREIVNRILLDDITGFTFSGGEPMEQAGGFAEVAHIARHERDINIICFTGYRYEHLLKDPPNSDVAGLLAQVDVLIDGPYVQALNDSIGLRGSANQRIIHLSSRLRDHDLESFKRSIEIRITNGELAFVGIPTPGMTSAMEGIL